MNAQLVLKNVNIEEQKILFSIIVPDVFDSDVLENLNDGISFTKEAVICISFTGETVVNCQDTSIVVIF